MESWDIASPQHTMKLNDLSWISWFIRCPSEKHCFSMKTATFHENCCFSWKLLLFSENRWFHVKSSGFQAWAFGWSPSIGPSIHERPKIHLRYLLWLRHQWRHHPLPSSWKYPQWPVRHQQSRTNLQHHITMQHRPWLANPTWSAVAVNQTPGVYLLSR